MLIRQKLSIIRRGRVGGDRFVVMGHEVVNRC